MLIYDGFKSDFMRQIEEGTLVETIESTILNKLGRHTGTSEIRSWQNSMQHMYTVLNDISIPDNSGIAIEYNIPHTSKRVDFMISGYDKADKPCAVIIELKQWEHLNAIDGSDSLVETFTGGANRKVVHPSYQAWSYASLIKDYNQSVQDKMIGLYLCVFMHNYTL